MKRGFSDRLLVSITGWKDIHWENKLKEIDKFKLKKVALFLEIFKEKEQRKEIYEALLNSKIKEIPLVHIRNDMEKSELDFLYKNFKSRYFTIHESSFNILKKWRGYYKNLYLEMNYDNFVSDKLDVSKIDGFCVDLSHFKCAEEKFSKEFEYIVKRSKIHRYFKCNHINGYSYKLNVDVHTIRNLKEFDYLKTLPKFLFGDYIGIEVFNSIKEQLKFKKYLVKML
ncbi:MAG: hypothetical protein KJ674_02555 [Nanoarchaeota archaeon]|nr:hypothetical protein [Nanoarchaeota archaeon]